MTTEDIHLGGRDEGGRAMDGSVSHGRAERKRLMDMDRRSPAPAVRMRSLMVLLLAEGQARATR
jgi:hypothetical protein